MAPVAVQPINARVLALLEGMAPEAAKTVSAVVLALLVGSLLRTQQQAQQRQTASHATLVGMALQVD